MSIDPVVPQGRWACPRRDHAVGHCFLVARSLQRATIVFSSAAAPEEKQIWRRLRPKKFWKISFLLLEADVEAL